jgi:hypothetical protein
MENRGWFKKGDDARRHPLTPDERRRGGQRAYAQLKATRPAVAWHILHGTIKPKEHAQRDRALRAWAEARQRQEEPDDIPD